MDPPDLEKKQDGIKVLKYVNIVSKREQKNKAKAKKTAQKQLASQY